MIKIGLLGFGTVNSGVYEGIIESIDYLQQLLQDDICINKILVRDKEKHKFSQNEKLITENANDFFKEEFDIVFEAMGGVQPAFDYTTYLLTKKVPIITANKELIAKHGKTLEKLAQKNNVFIGYEATVAGGIPIINTIRSQLQWTAVRSISGILNGTTNYIITKLNEGNVTFETVLQEAQLKGFAEADPTSDIEGYDALYKLQILCKLCFGEWVKEEAFNRYGITHLQPLHFQIADALELKIKFIATAHYDEKGVHGAVSPCFIDRKHPLAAIENENNGVYLQGDWLGNFVASGPGAGKKPTATSMIEDYLHQLQRKQKIQQFSKRTEIAKVKEYEYILFYSLKNSSVQIDYLKQQLEVQSFNTLINNGEIEVTRVSTSEEMMNEFLKHSENVTVFPLYRENRSIKRLKMRDDEVKLSV